MRDTQSPGDSARKDDTPITVVLVGSEDTATWLAETLTAQEIRHRPPATGLEQINTTAFDCLVLADGVDPDWETLEALDRPVIFYGETANMPSPQAVQKGVDVILQRGESFDTELLSFTIQSLAEKRPVKSTVIEALDAIDEQQNDAVAFLLDDEDNVRWSSSSLETLLPPDAAGQLSAEQSLPEQIETVFERPGTLQSAETSDSAGELLSLRSAQSSRYYRRYSYPVGTERLERIELIQDITTTLSNYDRLTLFENLVENAEDGLFVLNADWQVEYINSSYAEMIGYEREELLSTHVAHQLSPGEMRRAQEATERLLEGDAESEVIDLTLERDDGTEIDAAVHFWLRQSDGGYEGVMGVIRDITERKERKRELERYETIVQAVGDPVCTFDSEGRFVYVNEAFEERTGYDREAVSGESAMLITDEETVETAESLIETLQTDDDRTKATFEMDLQPKQGSPIPTECQIALLPREDGEFQGTVAVFRDISRLKRREQRLSKFAGVVSHDLRNPLDVALGRVEVLPELVDLHPETRTHLDEIHESLRRMEQLIQDVLTITRQREGEFDISPVDLEELTQEAWGNVDTRDAQLEIVETIELRAHRQRLMRVLENLFRNAVEHAGPEVTVTVGTLKTDWKQGQAGFYVADDGDGVAPEKRGQIFDDGFSTTDGGTGLGLTIVREIARAHDWTVSLEESEAGGARFEFTGVSLA